MYVFMYNRQGQGPEAAGRRHAKKGEGKNPSALESLGAVTP
jgi:hypothetical protein